MTMITNSSSVPFTHHDIVTNLLKLTYDVELALGRAALQATPEAVEHVTPSMAVAAGHSRLPD
jgi:hypothetical protein